MITFQQKKTALSENKAVIHYGSIIYTYDRKEATIQRLNNDVVNGYKKKADNYFLYLLISIGVLAITIITFSIILIKKKDNRHKIKNKNKLM